VVRCRAENDLPRLDDREYERQPKQLLFSSGGQRHRGRGLDTDVMTLDDFIGVNESIEQLVTFIGMRDASVSIPGNAGVCAVRTCREFSPSRDHATIERIRASAFRRALR
jgi:hypothetical protein